MSFVIPELHIPDNSPEARAVERVMRDEQVGPDAAVRRILRSAADVSTPAQRMIGLFSSDEDAALIDDVRTLVAEARRTQTSRENKAGLNLALEDWSGE